MAQSLQISKSNFILKILLPSKKKAIKNAIVLISGKAFGETLAVLMVAGNIIAVPKALFESFRTINANIALEMPYALGIHRSALFFLGLLSFIIILFFSLLSSRQEKE